jgi:hypothetical protein
MTHTFTKHTRILAATVGAGALLAAPAAALAGKGDHGTSKSHGKGAAGCTTTHSHGYALTGTLVAVTADDAATPASEATVTLKVLHGNGAARRSGDIADQDAVRPGVQIRGAEFTVPAGDAFVLRLKRYQGTDTPSVGDRVKVKGRIAATSKKCAAAGASIADRLGAIDVRRVTISDRDQDA